MTSSLRGRISRIYPGWWVAVTGTVVLAVLAGSQTSVMGLFFVALLREFGWSRTLLSGAFTLVRVEGSMLGPVEGFLTDRLGPHRMVLAGFLVAGAGFLVLSQVSRPLHFYLALLLMSAGVGLGTYLPVTAAVNWWFSRHRNQAMGLTLAGFSLGAIWSPVFAWAISRHDWRAAALVLGILLLTVGYPLSRVLRARPTPRTLAREERHTTTRGPGSHAEEGQDFTLGQAVRTRAFWVIPLAMAANSFSTSAVYVHGVAHLTDIGLSLQTAAGVWATYGVVEVLMRVFGSFIGDRIDKRWGICAYCTVQAVAMVLLALARSAPMAFVFAVAFGIGHGGRGPLFVAIRGEYFGRRQFGTIMGVGNLLTSLPGIATPLVLGVLFDLQGTYLPSFLGIAALAFGAGLLILFASRPRLPTIAGPSPVEHG